MTRFALILAAALAASTSPEARATDALDRREAQLRDRIEYGLHTGALTPREARALLGELNDIVSEQRRFEYDGRLSRRERRELNDALDALGGEIRLQVQDYRQR